MLPIISTINRDACSDKYAGARPFRQCHCELEKCLIRNVKSVKFIAQYLTQAKCRY